MNDPANLTDEEVRLDFLVEHAAMKPSEALRFIRQYPNPTTWAEVSAICSQRLVNFADVVTEAMSRLRDKR